MDNLVVHIVLPKGLALTSGAVLDDDQTLLVVGSIAPCYSSVDLVRTEGGVYLRELGDLAIAAEIYKVSKEADTLSCVNLPDLPPGTPATDPVYKQHRNFLTGRQEYVSKKSAYNCLLNILGLSAVRGTKTLGNFSVSRQDGRGNESAATKTSDLRSEFTAWKIVVQSAGAVGLGGTARPTFAAKGKYDPSSIPPGRLWITTGLGANQMSVPGFGSGAGSVKYSSSPVIQWRLGRYPGGYVTSSFVGRSV